jgi:hypothetical protein
MKGNPYRTLGAERAHRDFLESRGVVPEQQVKLSRYAAALFEAALQLAEGQPEADLWIPYTDIGQALIDAGLVARTCHADGRVTYRLTDAGMRWRES